MNKACVISNPKQDLTLTGNSRNPWKLCRVQQVEDLKSLISVLPIWSTGIILSLVTGCQVSFIVLQAKVMDRHTFIQGFQIPSGSYGIFLVISFVLFLVLYDILIVPLVSWALREPFRLGVMVRMGAGYVISVLCIFTLAAVEHARKTTSVSIQSGSWFNFVRVFRLLVLFWLGVFHFLCFSIIIYYINKNKLNLIWYILVLVFNSNTFKKLYFSQLFSFPYKFWFCFSYRKRTKQLFDLIICYTISVWFYI